MADHDEAIRALRDALQFSPDNIPLRLHLAKTLVGFGLFEEAEKEYRQALALAPANVDIKLALATVYERQGKGSQAMVVMEDIVSKPDAPASAYVQYARMLLRADMSAMR